MLYVLPFLTGFISLYISLPLLVRFSTKLTRKLVFLPFFRWPRPIDLSHHTKLGLEGALSLRIPTQGGMEVGAWYVPPKSISSQGKDLPLNSGHPVFIYLHGASGSRANMVRFKLYWILQNLDYHIVSFDYRGYADSSTVDITEDTVVADAHFVVRFVEERKGNAPLFIWGHSLGTGVGTRLAAELCQDKRCPTGLILESPFNSLSEAARHHPLLLLYRYMPFFEHFFLRGAHDAGIIFNSEAHIVQVTSPILILHAEDDFVIPFQLGKKLSEHARRSKADPDLLKPELDRKDFRNLEKINFKLIEAGSKCGHCKICAAPEFSEIVKNFVDFAIGQDVQ
ncbi:lysophosphatidylserine lipase ABHD12-like [Artemia franciscana]|uniref:lysophosphatidylserine lipase ABHD12-like n=1 Tax=Artemia franciscana TaxID=6661 RepID=UPI0032DA4B90